MTATCGEIQAKMRLLDLRKKRLRVLSRLVIIERQIREMSARARSEPEAQSAEPTGKCREGQAGGGALAARQPRGVRGCRREILQVGRGRSGPR